MRFTIAAALALTAAPLLHAQTTAPGSITDFSVAVPLPGNWAYATFAGGSEASFTDASGHPQLFVRCSRASRQVTIASPAAAAAPSLNIWTTSQTRNLAASYDPATYRLSANVTAYDPVLDAIAFSRGRVLISGGVGPTLAVPTWPEAARSIEDCRN